MRKAAGRPAWGLSGSWATGEALALFLVLAMVLPAAAAHAAPPPQEPAVRLLHDHNDDCGAGGVGPQCRGSHDLVALDAHIGHDPELGDVVVFRFFLDGGKGGAMSETLSFSSGQTAHAFRLDWSGGLSGDFDRVGPKVQLDDGTRFAVDATLAFATIGAAPGDVLSDFRVVAARDGLPGDHMPGGVQGPDGNVTDPREGDHPTAYERPSLRLGPARPEETDAPALPLPAAVVLVLVAGAAISRHRRWV